MLVQSAFRSQLFLSVLAHSSVSVVDDGEDAHLSRNYSFLRFLNPFTPIGDQDRISPYNINTISCRQVMRINTNTNQGLLLDPKPNSLSWKRRSGIESLSILRNVQKCMQ